MEIFDSGSTSSVAKEEVEMKSGEVKDRKSRYDVMIVRYNFTKSNNDSKGFALKFDFKSHSTSALYSKLHSVRLHFTQSYTQYVCTLIDTTQSAFGVVFTFTFMILFLGCCFMIF